VVYYTATCYLRLLITHYRYGLDLINGQVKNSMKYGVLEPAMSKIKALKAATEAAISILRIDDMIKIDPPQRQDDGGH
jgi:T-complex protein 1 subunit alpha